MMKMNLDDEPTNGEDDVVYIILISLFSCASISSTYSLVRLVWPNTEELISRPFMGLSKIRLLLQDSILSPKNVR